MVLEAGIEPARLTSADFKSAVATDYTTRANSPYENILFWEGHSPSLLPTEHSVAFPVDITTRVSNLLHGYPEWALP